MSIYQIASPISPPAHVAVDISQPLTAPAQIAPSKTSTQPLENLLREKGLIDEYGLIIQPESLPPFPALDAGDLDELRKILEKSVSVRAGSKRMELSLKEILLHSYLSQSDIVSKIEIVGGFTRKLLLSSPRLVARILEALTGLPPEELKPYVEQIVSQAIKKPLPDIDIRVLSSDNRREVLGNFTYTLVNLFAAKMQCPPYEARKTAFTKFHLIHDLKNQFSIATIKPENSFEFELLFVGSLLRNHLFMHDSIRLSILPFLMDQGSVEIESDYGPPWQPIIDLLTKTIHIPNPESVDLFGFPLLMSFYTRGHKPSYPDEGSLLSSKVTQLSQYHVGIPEQVAGLLKTTCSNHHKGNPLEALTVTLNACLHLNTSSSNLETIWALMRAEHWQDSDLAPAPLLSLIDQALFEHKISFRALSAALSIFCADTDGRVAVEGTELHLLAPLNRPDAVDYLSAHLLENPEMEGLTPLIFKSNSSLPPLKEAGLQDKASELLLSKSRSLRFLGYLLFSAFKENESTCLLIEHFLYFLNFLPLPQRLSFIDSLKKHPLLFEPLEKFKEIYNSKLNESQQLKEWILILANSPEHVLYGKNLWMKYREKYPIKKRQKLDNALMRSLLPESWKEAVSIFAAGQIESEPRAAKYELKIIAALLPYVNNLPEASFQVEAPKIYDLLIFTLSKAEYKKSKSVTATSFTRQFSVFFERLINSENKPQAQELLELAGAHPLLKASDPHLYRCRMTFLESEDLEPKRMYNEWKKLEQLGPCPNDQTPLYRKVHFKAIECLASDKEFELEGFDQLRTYAKGSPPDEVLIPYIVRDISQLAASRRDASAVKLIDSVYHSHLTPEILAEQRYLLFNNYIVRGELATAYKLWKTINEPYPETTKILIELLTKHNKPEKNLKAALRLLRNEISDVQMPLNDKIHYFLKIYSFTGSSKLLVNIANQYLNASLDFDNQKRLTHLIVAAFTTSEEVDKNLLETVEEKIDYILEVLRETGDDQGIESVMQSLILHDLPWQNFPFCRSRAEYYLNCKDHARALAWMKRADSRDEKFTGWLNQILIKYQTMQPEEEAETLLFFKDSLVMLEQFHPLINRGIDLAGKPELPFKLSLALLETFSPDTSAPWERLLNSCAKENYPLFWKKFYAWLTQTASSGPETRRTILKAIDCCPVVPELFNSLDDPASPLGRLSNTSAEKMEMKGKLIISRMKSVKNVEDIFPLFDPLHKEIDEHSLFAYRDITLELASECLNKKSLPFTKYACEIFSAFVPIVAVKQKSLYSEQIADTLIMLMKEIHSDASLHDSEQAALLTYSCNALRQTFGTSLPLLKIASALSMFNTLYSMVESIEFLNISEDSNLFREAWGRILPFLMENALSSGLPNAEQLAIDLFAMHHKKLEQDSAEHFQCSDLVFDVAIKYLDSKEGLNHFSDLIPSHLDAMVDDEISSFSIIFETPLRSHSSPVFHLHPEASQKTRAIFFNRIKSLLSKILIKDIRNDSLEGFAHHFMTKNLTFLCDHFSEQRSEIVPLLNRFYYRYPPDRNFFYFSHLGFAAKLLKHARDKGIYTEPYEPHFSEALLFLENKADFPLGQVKGLQVISLEKVIDRFISSGTPYAVIRAVQVMQLTQHGVLDSHLDTLKRIYGKLLQAAMLNPFDAFDGSTLFEWVRLGLMMDRLPVIGYSNKKSGKQTATELCEMLFDHVFELSKAPHTFAGAPETSKILLSEWLTKLLILSRMHMGYTDSKGVEKYYRQAEKLYPQITDLFEEMNLKQKKLLAAQMTRAIIGERFKLSKKQRKKRSEIMRNWLLGIASQTEICAGELLIAKNHQVFAYTPKDAAKVEAKIKTH